MGTELLILIGSIVGGTGAMLSFWAGWNARDRQDQLGGSYRLPPRYRPGYRSINYPDPSPDRRPTNPYTGDPVTFTEGRTQRGNGNGAPSTPKPAIYPKPQNRRNPFISDFQRQINDYLGLNGDGDGN